MDLGHFVIHPRIRLLWTLLEVCPNLSNPLPSTQAQEEKFPTVPYHSQETMPVKLLCTTLYCLVFWENDEQYSNSMCCY